MRTTLLVAIAVGLSGCSYNKFTTQEEAIKAQWAQVQNQLQRRNDLIPNLVETVKGYAAHEEGDLQGDRRLALAAARRRSRRKKRSQAANQQIVGARPAARGRRELSAAEGQRAVQPADGRARRAPRTGSRPSACATTSASRNTTRSAGSFPANVTAKMFGFKEYPFFEAPPEAQAGAEGELRDVSRSVKLTSLASMPKDVIGSVSVDSELV